MISRLRDKLADDQVVKAFWCGISDPQYCAAIANLPFDAIVLDCQHGFHDERSVLNAIPHVVTAGKSPVVRIPPNRWDMCERALDFGALGLIAPMVNNAEDARQFAEAAKFPQIGGRSHGPRHAASLYGIDVSEYLLEANQNTITLAQIETQEAYDNLDEIISVDGIDGILMGPADFSIFVTGNPLPDVYGSATVQLVEDIASRTRAIGKVAAAFTNSNEHANLVYGFGYRFISLSLDGSLLAHGANKVLENLDF